MTAPATQPNAGATNPPTHRHFIAGEWVDSNGGGTFESINPYTEWKSIYVDFSGRLQRAQIDNQA